MLRIGAIRASANIPRAARALCIVALLATVGCTRPDVGAVGTAANTVTRSYEVDEAIIRNPERGMVQFVHMDDPGDVAFVAGLDFVSLANARVRLDAFRDRPIDSAFLADLERGFGRIRRAGLKLVLRFQYNIGSGKDPSIEQVLAHVGQLAPILQRNADIIAVLQAGFIGAWGEWHNSISGLTAREPREALLRALIELMPANRSIQVRSPVFKLAFAGGPATTPARSAAGPLTRLGHHNDCFLSSDDDHGTFPDAATRAYLEADSRFVPVGGETCAAAPPRTDCPSALAELRRFHYSYLNRAYHPEVIETWRQQGCLHAITRDLGYRLALRVARWPKRARSGATIRVDLSIDNLGFAAPYNARPAFVVVGEGSDRRAIPVAELDVRRLLPGESHEVALSVTLPDDLTPGVHRLALWLPDSTELLRARTEYSMRLSNMDTWSDADGTNVLGHLRID